MLFDRFAPDQTEGNSLQTEGNSLQTEGNSLQKVQISYDI